MVLQLLNLKYFLIKLKEFMSDKNENKLIVLTAIISIAILEGIALYKGIDGTYFALTLSAISGLGGYILPSPFNKTK